MGTKKEGTSTEGNSNGHGRDGADPGANANDASGDTHRINEDNEGGFEKPKGTGPGGIDEGQDANTRKTCREQGLVCVHVRGGNVDHWPGIRTFLRVGVGLSL